MSRRRRSPGVIEVRAHHAGVNLALEARDSDEHASGITLYYGDMCAHLADACPNSISWTILRRLRFFADHAMTLDDSKQWRPNGHDPRDPAFLGAHMRVLARAWLEVDRLEASGPLNKRDRAESARANRNAWYAVAVLLQGGVAVQRAPAGPIVGGSVSPPRCRRAVSIPS